MGTFARLLMERAGDDRTGMLFEDERYTWAQIVRASRERAALARSRLGSDGPPHVGVLLDNVPEYLFWLGGAALAGAALVGINPTRRGAELARDIRHTDCRLIVTDAAHAGLLDGLDLGAPVLRVEDLAYGTQLSVDPAADQRLLLLFTSGSTGDPKAVVCSQGRLAHIASYAESFGITRDAVTYVAMPMFHGNSIMANVAMATFAGATIVLRRRFSASGFLPDVRRYGVTYFNYVGRALAYILATPERPDDADNTLTSVFGTEASARDMAAFARRYGCRVVESYGSSEGAISMRRTPDTPPGALGVSTQGEAAIYDPQTGRECPRARFGPDGALLNAEAAIGEIVGFGATFEGYYNDPAADAERMRDGVYWSGDLGYRDADGFFYFAGRGADRLRVDGENFAAGPIERILSRWARVAAVYPVPDTRTGDQVMAALELAGRFHPEAFAAFLAAQPDLGTKWAPRFVRIVARMPLTASNKIDKRPLRREGWASGEVWWRPGRELRYEPLTDQARAALRAEAKRHNRMMA